MAGNRTAIKSRIKSVNATKKITGAMELISSAKLQKSRNQMLKNREYNNILVDTVNQILSGDIDADSEFLKKKDNPKKAIIVFCSDLGLCGGYNINIFKLVKENATSDDYLYVVGSKEYNNLKKSFNVQNELLNSDNLSYAELKKITDTAIELYRNNEIGKIEVIYTSFVNNVTFNAKVETVIPCTIDTKEVKKSNVETLLEPNADDILEHLIPMMIESDVYAKWMEAKTSEQGSRRFAMENATDNAEELNDKLLLQYNQARQSAITQEITEIVGGANALE